MLDDRSELVQQPGAGLCHQFFLVREPHCPVRVKHERLEPALQDRCRGRFVEEIAIANSVDEQPFRSQMDIPQQAGVFRDHRVQRVLLVDQRLGWRATVVESEHGVE